MALVFHELTTNAAKYGALTVDGGTIVTSWHEDDGDLVLRWAERNGPPVKGAPAPDTLGFGSTLVRNSVTHQLGETLHHDWQPAGLTLEIKIPITRLAG